MKTIYAIKCSGTHIGNLSSYFPTKEKAETALAKIAKDRRHKMGVTVIDDSPVKFAFLLGWEENRVAWEIVEIILDKN